MFLEVVFASHLISALMWRRWTSPGMWTTLVPWSTSSECDGSEHPLSEVTGPQGTPLDTAPGSPTPSHHSVASRHSAASVASKHSVVSTAAQSVHSVPGLRTSSRIITAAEPIQVVSVRASSSLPVYYFYRFQFLSVSLFKSYFISIPVSFWF